MLNFFPKSYLECAWKWAQSQVTLFLGGMTWSMMASKFVALWSTFFRHTFCKNLAGSGSYKNEPFFQSDLWFCSWLLMLNPKWSMLGTGLGTLHFCIATTNNMTFVCKINDMFSTKCFTTSIYNICSTIYSSTRECVVVGPVFATGFITFGRISALTSRAGTGALLSTPSIAAGSLFCGI